MRIPRTLASLALLIALACLPGISPSAHAQGMQTSPHSGLSADPNADFESLLFESQSLLASGRPIDARAKLQQAMAINPQDYRVHMYLGQYYLFEVAHFKLAYKYLRNAEKLFEDNYGPDAAVPPAQSRFHLMLLYLISEAELNLDRYEDSLGTLDRIAKYYMTDWYPGTRAWVLMKLKRIDEAISVAQSGLLANSDPERTWNILGILLSVSGNREASLEAFGNAIKAEMTGFGNNQVATPLNNAGEVYRELFEDPLAEASWRTAVKLPDGCDHILPSLNLAMLYIEQLRLFQAQRTLRNFEACFAQKPEREDSEHRTLLALSRGQILLHNNDIEVAMELIDVARQDQQWFGKIGTNQNDVELASNYAMARAFRAKAEALRDTPVASLYTATRNILTRRVLLMRAAWLERQSFRLALQELDDFEDLFIRNTDTLLEYPSLGDIFRWLPTASVKRRMERMMETDTRPMAANFYKLYLATNYVHQGELEEAAALLDELEVNFRTTDRLALANVYAQKLLLNKAQQSWFSDPEEEERVSDYSLREKLFALHPFLLRYYAIALPVRVELQANNEVQREYLEEIYEDLAAFRFTTADDALPAEAVRYSLVLAATAGNEDTKLVLSVQLLDTQSNQTLVSEQITAAANEESRIQLVAAFIKKAFAHRQDPSGGALPRIPILEGVFKQ